jgi:ubiquinone/menaquinone biosynthesis C-methylase UbiE
MSAGGDARLRNEIEHGRFLAAQGAGEVWNWATPAGRLRKLRRAAMLGAGLAPGMEVLELGCGTGLFTREFARSGARLTALDISPELLELARREVSAENVVFAAGNAYAMDFPPERFDRVVGSSVLHHLDAPRALAECFRVLKPGGTLAFTEPNMLNPQIAMEKNIAWIKKRTGNSPDETAFFRRQVSRLLARAGFHDIRVVPFDFLHPAIPESLLGVAVPFTGFLEKVPLLRAIAGSLHIRAVK